MATYFAVILDDKRMSQIKGTGLEEKITSMFGGAVKSLVIELSDELGKKVIEPFPKARFDARFFIEETPLAFRRAVFKRLVEMKSLGPEVIEKVLSEDLEKIKEEAKKEDAELPVPDVDISDILKLQENPVQKP
ncbi:MAG: hypothetical protein ABDH16_02520 [Thermodesulfovibrionaceae bacterium]